MTGRTTRPVPVATDDAAVIEASFGEPDRFASLFDRHAPHIHRYLARRVGRQAADDLVAETFLVAFGKRGGIQGQLGGDALLRTAITNAPGQLP